jgi:hypothetical protein
VVIAVHMPTTDLLIQDTKYRVMWGSSEQKTIPVSGFDFASNLGDELRSTLTDDGRAVWRVATSAEQETLSPLFKPDVSKRGSFPLPAIDADRALLVETTYGAFIGLRKWVQVTATLLMADTKTGRTIWRAQFLESTGLPDTLENMQADNQKMLKETINKVMEKFVTKTKKQILKAAS